MERSKIQYINIVVKCCWDNELLGWAKSSLGLWVKTFVDLMMFVQVVLNSHGVLVMLNMSTTNDFIA